MSPGSWSLASRLTKLFAITTSALVLLITLVSAWFVSRSAEHSIAALAREKVDEMISFHDTKGSDAELLESFASELRVKHRSFPMAWRIWRADGGSVFATLGDQSLLEDVVISIEPAVRGSTQSFPKDLRAVVVNGKEKSLFACIVDGSTRLNELRRYGTIGLILVLVTIVTIFMVGHVLVRRVSLTLREVAESARRVHGSDQSMQVDVRNAPEEIREIVSALQEMLSNVQAEAERNRIFTASMAHELRSPIQNLMGETEVALMTPRDGAEYRRVLGSHLQELRDLADAVDNLVTICSQHKRGADVQTRESFDLAPEATLRLAREKGYAAARGVRLNLECKGDTHIYGDREGLLRAMRNLTANAIEWSAPGSEVDVLVEGENGRVVVTVDDAGPGVPEELKDRIFEAFFRGPQAKGRRIGYGLGLAIVRSAVASQGGEIEVGRSPKGGARFSLFLPRNLGRNPSDDTPAPT